MRTALEIQNTFNLAMFDGEETGLYYYGARYYNPRISLWYGVDPLAEKYPAHSPYCYTMNNPIMLIDPDGAEIFPAHGTWSDSKTWKKMDEIKKASNQLFGDGFFNKNFMEWSGGNYATGAQEFFYGRLGELTKVRRTHIIPNHAVATFETSWKYDSWNRVQEMIYPDKEKLSYHYDAGGQLEGLTGNKAYSYNYVQDIGYDKFGQRTYIKYCNGTETTYNYDPQMRRLQALQAKNQSRTFMNNVYSFDDVGNILSVNNKAEAGDVMGGLMSHTYTYDGLYRLATAEGEFTGSDNKVASYSLEMGYDNMHNITSKKQHIAQTDVAFEGNLLAGYELEYNYRTDKPHQLESIKDNNYRTADSTAVASSTKAISDAYSYDSNGNLISVISNDSVQTNIKERQLSWDEENRLRSICDNGYVSSYFYDAGGERTVKLHGGAEGIHVNSAFSGGYTNNTDYTLYVNAYMVLEKGGQYTKHIYIGSQRIVSKLGDVGSFGIDPRREEYAGEDVAGVAVPDYASKYEALQDVIKDNYATFEVDYYGADNDNYVAGEGFCCGDNNLKTKSIADDSPNYEKLQYYYHSDHLGSASYITNLDGEVVQHIEYVPFGEVFLEERNNTWNTPFLFNGKELDEETGLYYYGARYYNPRISLWLSTDPLHEKYPHVSTYAYTFNNPIRFIDAWGLEGDEPETKFSESQIERLTTYINDNISKGNDDCITTVIKGMRKLQRGQKITATTPMKKLMKAWEKTGHGKERVDISFKEKAGTEPSELKESVGQKMIDESLSEDGTYVFGLGMEDGYHTATVTLEKKGANTSFTYNDQMERIEGMDIQQLDDRITSWSKSGFNHYKYKGVTPPNVVYFQQYINRDAPLKPLKSIPITSIIPLNDE